MRKRHFNKKNTITLLIVLIQVILIIVTGILAFGTKDEFLQSGTEFSPFETLTLEKGTYRLDFSFESGESANAVTMISFEKPDAIQADTLHFYTWKTNDSLLVWVKEPVTDGNLAHNFPGPCQIRSITFYRTGAENTKRFLVLSLTLLTADACYLWIRKWKRLENDRKGAVARALLLLAGVALSSMSLWKPVIYFGADTAFHLARIQGIADGLLNGEFPVRINTYWLDGAGVAIPIFYGDFLLYIPTIFYLCGFTLQAAMKIYIVLISLLTAVGNYRAFSILFQKKWIALVASLCNLFSTYRIANAVQRGDIGEYTAIAFIPMAFCGLLIIFENDERIRKGVLLLALGTAGCLCTHNLSTLLLIANLALIFILKLLFDHRNVLKKSVFTAIGAAAGIAGCLSAFFWIPMFTYLLTGDMGITNGSLQVYNRTADHYAKRTLGLKELLSFGGSNMRIEALGIPFFVIALLYAILLIRKFLIRRKNADGKTTAFSSGPLVFLMFLLELYLSSKLAPWDFWYEKSALIGKWISTLQFPFRHHSMTTALGTLLAGYLLKELAEIPFLQNRKGLARIPLVLLLLLCSANAFFFQKRVNETANGYKMFSKACFSVYTTWGLDYSFELPDAFYLPSGVDMMYYRGTAEHLPEFNPTVIFTGDIVRKGVTTTLRCQNPSSEATFLLVPYVMYPGYEAVDVNTHEHLSIQKGPAAMAMVTLPGGYNGTLRICFHEPVIWRLAELISLLTVISLIAISVRIRKKNTLH